MNIQPVGAAGAEIKDSGIILGTSGYSRKRSISTSAYAPAGCW